MLSRVAFRSPLAGTPASFLRRQLSTVMKTEDALELVETKTIGRKAIARVPLAAGTVINVFREPVEGRPTMHTVQFDETTHVAPTLGAEFISHACAGTNTRIVVHDDRKAASFVVTKDVDAGEDLSFNYNTTEWDMNSPFPCECADCKASGVTRSVRGFKHLSNADRMLIMNEVSPFVRQRTMEELKEIHEMIHAAEDDVEYFAVLEGEQEEDRRASSA